VLSDLDFENVSTARYRAKEDGGLWSQGSPNVVDALRNIVIRDDDIWPYRLSRLSRLPAFSTSNSSNSNAFGRNGISEPSDDSSAPRLRSSLCCPKLNTRIVG
jgi:hypothetical protein